MASMSGIILLCDQVYQVQGGKFVIAGTYTTIEVRCAEPPRAVHTVNGLNLYLRLRPERLGVHRLAVAVRDELSPPWREPLISTQWETRIDERGMRLFEMAMVSPSFVVRVQTPEDPATAAKAAEGVRLKYSIGFQVDGELIATTPLDIAFVHDGSRG